MLAALFHTNTWAVQGGCCSWARAVNERRVRSISSDWVVLPGPARVDGAALSYRMLPRSSVCRVQRFLPSEWLTFQSLIGGMVGNGLTMTVAFVAAIAGLALTGGLVFRCSSRSFGMVFLAGRDAPAHGRGARAARRHRRSAWDCWPSLHPVRRRPSACRRAAGRRRRRNAPRAGTDSASSAGFAAHRGAAAARRRSVLRPCLRAAAACAACRPGPADRRSLRRAVIPRRHSPSPPHDLRLRVPGPSASIRGGIVALVPVADLVSTAAATSSMRRREALRRRSCGSHAVHVLVQSGQFAALCRLCRRRADRHGRARAVILLAQVLAIAGLAPLVAGRDEAAAGKPPRPPRPSPLQPYRDLAKLANKEVLLPTASRPIP